ncbi:MAG: hypothetical protein KY468_00840 [Armatimonadetes bacterium]|nr:hypothetical protein [Armatimonadota bacterium]
MSLTSPETLEEIALKTAEGASLSLEDGLALFRNPHLTEIGALALLARRVQPDPGRVTYSLGVRLPWETLESQPDKAERALKALSDAGGREVRLTGTLPESWDLERAVNRLSALRKFHSAAEVTAFTPQQVAHLAGKDGLSAGKALDALSDAGWATLGPFPFESTSDSPSFNPEDDSALPGILQHSQGAGVPVTTMVELPPSMSPEDRLSRLFQLRDLQDLTGGAIITVIPLNTERAVNYTGSAFDYLRAVAVTRLVLDNVPHIQSSWETHDLKVAQLALEYGADDFGTVWMEFLSNAPTPHLSLPLEEVERNIREAGFIPQARNARFEPIEPPRSPVVRTSGTPENAASPTG